MEINRKRQMDWPYAIFMTFLLLWGLIIIYPFYNAALVSLVPQHIYIRTPFLLYPKELTFTSYEYIFQWRAILYGFRSTTLILFLGTIYNILLTISTAYALTKPIPGRKFFSYFIILTMYIQGGLIPYYLLIRNLGLVNSYGAMILPTGINIMYMLIMKSYFQTLPPDLEESAKIDGANDLYILFRIILPISLPMLATITLYYGVDRWNEWWLGMLFIRQVEKQPLQLMIRNMLQASSVITESVPGSMRKEIFPRGIQMAAIIITMAPIACVYPFLQKYFVKGLALGAVKA